MYRHISLYRNYPRILVFPEEDASNIVKVLTAAVWGMAVGGNTAIHTYNVETWPHPVVSFHMELI